MSLQQPTDLTNQPSARAFRPKTFSDVKGQEHVTQVLINALKNKKIPHAYLFSGTRGCGKTTLARLIAKSLNCQEAIDSIEPCCHCSSCKEMESGNSLNCIEIDGASHRGIDDIRQIKENISLRASAGGYKIYIIDEVHMLTKEAFNALLKTLEEPPTKVLFILATTEAHKVPDTVLSRCQCFCLKQISEKTIVEQLMRIAKYRGVEVREECIVTIASLAHGSMRDSLSLFDQVLAFSHKLVDPNEIYNLLHLPPPKLLAQIDHALQTQNLGTLFSLAQEVCQFGYNPSSFFEQLTLHVRHHLVRTQLGFTALDLPTNEQKKLYEKSVWSFKQCVDLLDIVTHAKKTTSFQANLRLHIELCFLSMLRTLFPEITNVSLHSNQEEVGGNTSLQKSENKKPTLSVNPAQTNPLTASKKGAAVPDTHVHKQKTPAKLPKKEVQADESRPLNACHYDTLLQFTAKELGGQIQIISS